MLLFPIGPKQSRLNAISSQVPVTPSRPSGFGRRLSSRQFDACIVVWRSSDAPVARQQWSVERLRESDIRGIVSGEIISQFPNARQKKSMRIPPQRKVAKINQSRLAALLIDLARRRVSADDLRHLPVDEMGDV